MRLLILGCSSGIGDNGRTTSLLVDQDILVDAGSGVGDLSVKQMSAVNYLFLTHSHLDHIAFLPLLANSTIESRNTPLTVFAHAKTITILKENIFNGKIWPDYTSIPNTSEPYIRMQPIKVGQTITLQERRITALPVKHAVPAVAYQLDSGNASFVFSGDTTFTPTFWDRLKKIDNLRYLMIETTFLNEQSLIAKRSGHTTPELLGQGLRLLERRPEILITHVEPGKEMQMLEEIKRFSGEFQPRMLQRGEIFEF